MDMSRSTMNYAPIPTEPPPTRTMSLASWNLERSLVKKVEISSLASGKPKGPLQVDPVARIKTRKGTFSPLSRTTLPPTVSDFWIPVTEAWIKVPGKHSQKGLC